MHFLCSYQLVNCPTVICSPSMLVIYHGETPLVNCGPRSIFYIWIQSTAIIYFLHFLQVTFIIHTIQLILCDQKAGEIDNLTVTLGQSFLVVLCAGVCPSPTGSITLVSFWGKTCCYTHHTFLLGYPNGRVIHVQATSFLAPLLGTWGTSAEQVSNSRQNLFSGAVATFFQAPHPPSCCKGSLTLPTFLLCLLSCLVYFYFVLFVSFIKNSKKISYLFLKLSFQVSWNV